MAPTKTRPLLWLLPALAASQSSCHKSRKHLHVDHRGRTTVQVEVHAPLLDVGGLRRLSAAGRLRPHRRGGPGRPGQASSPDDGRRAPAHGPLVDRRRISRGTQLVLQHTGAAQSELCHGSNVHPEFREARMRRPPRPGPGGRAVACVTTPTNYPSSPRAAARTTSASASASTTTLPL